MTDTGRAHSRGEDSDDSEDFERRLKAAGLDPAHVPADRDEFRRRLARIITMLINEWHGCAEPLCRRHQGCMAPGGRCSNMPPTSREELERDWPKVQAEIHAALKALVAAHGEP